MAARKIRPIRVEGNVAYITLTKGYVAIIDALDVPIVSGFNWCARVDFKSDGGVRCVYAFRRGPRGAMAALVHLHRAIKPVSDGRLIDHIDGDGLNNRRRNLREATARENAMNRKPRTDNRSGIKGVSFHRATQKWMARITHDGRDKHLGLFGCPTAAAVAYAKASADMHGAFGRLA